MTRNSTKIKSGIRALAGNLHEIISGTVVPDSFDSSEYTISVQPSDEGDAIQGVRLNTITGNGNGIILFPLENSNVIIGSIDGPGEWVLLRASEITKAVVKIESVNCQVDNRQVNIRNGDMIFNVSDSVFKMNASGESLYQLLKDCFTYIAALTVPTPSGTSSVPVNVADFNNLITRIDNLLTT